MRNPQTGWEEYRQAIYGKALPEHQERECALAFYAGMMVSFITISEIAGEGKASELDMDKAVEKLDELSRMIASAAIQAGKLREKP